MAGPSKKKQKKQLARANREALQQNVPAHVPGPSQAFFQRIQFTGPLPPPNVIEGYERIMPGAAQRLFDAADRQAAHRQQLESRVIDANIKQAARGQWFGLIVGLSGIIAATFLMSQGLMTEGMVVLFTDILALAGVFIIGRITGRKELKQKDPAAR